MTYDDAFEPLDPYERCLSVYGPHAIGRLDETRDELALAFDTRWIARVDYGAAIRTFIVPALVPLEPRFTHWGNYASPSHSSHELHKLFVEHVECSGPFDYPSRGALFIVVVEVPADAARAVDRLLASFGPYIGYANVGWPNALRAMLWSMLASSWQLEREHCDQPWHWIHTLPH